MGKIYSFTMIFISFLTSARPYQVLPLFLIIPAAALIMKKMALYPGLAVNLMIVNMLLCGVYLSFRAVRVLRWDSASPPPEPANLAIFDIASNCEDVRNRLRSHGYRFHREGVYGEKAGWRRFGFFLAYAGFTAVLAFGAYDNTRQFSGLFYIGIGNPFPLNQESTYSYYSKGTFIELSDIPFKLKGIERILPDRRYPNGATAVRLLSLDERQSWQFILPARGKGVAFGDFVFSMNSFEYDIYLVITTINNHILYSGWPHFVPLPQPKDGFTHKAEIKKDALNDVDGLAFYDQATDRLKLQIRHKQKRFEVELGEAPDHQKTVGDYVVKNDGIGRWSQLRIFRKRHTLLMAISGGIAITALVFALCTPRRRVWFQNSEEGTALLATDDPGLIGITRT